jgi:hypothetical protein
MHHATRAANSYVCAGPVGCARDAGCAAPHAHAHAHDCTWTCIRQEKETRKIQRMKPLSKFRAGTNNQTNCNMSRGERGWPAARSTIKTTRTAAVRHSPQSVSHSLRAGKRNSRTRGGPPPAPRSFGGRSPRTISDASCGNSRYHRSSFRTSRPQGIRSGSTF